MHKIYGKEVLHDFLRFLVQKIRQLLISVEKQDGVENGRQMDPMGQYFAMGTLKVVY